MCQLIWGVNSRCPRSDFSDYVAACMLRVVLLFILVAAAKAQQFFKQKKKYFKITSCKSKMWEYIIYIILKKICQRQDATGFLGAFSDFYHNVFCSSASCSACLQSIKWSSVMTQNWFMSKHCSSYSFNEVGVLWSLISILRRNTYSYSDELNLILTL